MKIWNGYGSEHSMNLVMIGHFKTPEDAKKTHQLIQMLSEQLVGKIEAGADTRRYSKEVLDILTQAEVWNLSTRELEEFLYDHHFERDKDKIILTTEESEVSAFFKLMIGNGAKIEMYSAHDYPDEENGRGK